MKMQVSKSSEGARRNDNKELPNNQLLKAVYMLPGSRQHMGTERSHYWTG
jgi:hypothetical protein